MLQRAARNRLISLAAVFVYLGAATALTADAMQRAAVELRALGMDREAIADALEVSPANAAVLCHRGRAELWRLLGDKFELTRRG